MRVLVVNDASSPVITQPTGANISLITTEIEINDTTWTALRGAGFSTRNTLAIQNQSSANPNAGGEFKLNGAQPSGYIGVLVTQNKTDGREYDIKQVEVYAKAKSGTFKITIEELS